MALFQDIRKVRGKGYAWVRETAKEEIKNLD